MSAHVLLYGAEGEPILTARRDRPEHWPGSVTRSVTIKVSAQYYGGHQYEGRDFFASHTCECLYADRAEASQAAQDAATSDAVEAAREYVATLRRISEQRKERGAA